MQTPHTHDTWSLGSYSNTSKATVLTTAPPIFKSFTAIHLQLYTYIKQRPGLLAAIRRQHAHQLAHMIWK